MAVDTTTARELFPVREKTKDRISSMPCCNEDGSRQFELMLIGKSCSPRLFGRNRGKKWGRDYQENNKAWMTASLFQEWPTRFDHGLVLRACKTAFIMNNCSAHGVNETLPQIYHATVLLLPTNRTSKPQSMMLALSQL